VIAFLFIAAAFLVGGFAFRRRRTLYVARANPDEPATMERIVCPFCRRWVKARIVDGVVTTECPDCGPVARPLGQETTVTVRNEVHR